MALFWKRIVVKPFSTLRCVCHCIVREGFDSLPESSEQEDDMLDKAWGLEPESRLSCQARVTDEDLVVEIPRYTINHAREH